jgi:predicted phosphodiesterase
LTHGEEGLIRNSFAPVTVRRPGVTGGMRLAALSDIHGNAEALRAVLTDVDLQGVDAIVVCGDLVVYGPEPLKVLELLRARRDVVCISGNTDRYLVERRAFTPMAEPWQRELLNAFPWTTEQIGAEGLRLLASLPARLHLPLPVPPVPEAQRRVPVPEAQRRVKGGSDILFVHGSPRSDEEGIYVDSEAELAAAIAETEARLLVCGHTHLPFAGWVAGQRVLNLGSVGLPFDGDRRAGYALIEIEGTDIRVELRRTAYAVEEVARLVMELDMPGAIVTVENLLRARPMSRDLIYQHFSGHT